jgi:uncharacterized LabA/DUF88 family protein
MTDRIAVFIDGGYIEKIAQDEFNGVRIDYQLLSKAMAHGFSHLRTYYYHCLPYQGQPPTEDEKKRIANKQRFFTALEKLNRFQVRQGYLRRRGFDSDGNPEFEQKGVDVYMAIDLVQLATKHLITHAAILTADSDFVPAIMVAKNEGVVIRLYHSATIGRAHQLWQSADDRILINNAFINQVTLQSTMI